MKKFTCALLAVIIVISFTGCNKPVVATEAFDKYLMEEFVEMVTTDTISLNYTLKNPETFGIKDIKPTFGDFNLDDIEKDEKEIDADIKKLKSFKYDELSNSQKLTYDIIMEVLKTAKMSEGLTFYSGVFSPNFGFQSQLNSVLPEYPIDSEKDLEEYFGLLKDMPRYVDQLIAFEKEKSKQGLFMSDKLADQVIVQCRDLALTGEKNVLISAFPNMIKSLELSDDDKNSYIAKNKEIVMESVLTTYSKIADELNLLKGTGKNTGGLSHFEKGKEYYEYLFKQKTGSSMSIDEAITTIDNIIVSQINLLMSLVAKNPTIEEDFINFKLDVTTPNEILDILEIRIADDYPPIKDVAYTVKSIDKSLEANSSPAFYIIPPIDAPEDNVIYTNDSSLNSPLRLFSTLAHEGYPGHLYQNNYFTSTNPHPVRNMLDFAGYNEGWASYVESKSFNLVNTDNEALAQYMQIDNILSLVLMSRIDIGVNYEGWMIDKVGEYLSRFYSKVPDEMTMAYCDLMVEEPGNSLPYCIGFLELIELEKLASEALGEKFVLKDFNKAILDVGPAPFIIVKAEVEKWMATVK